MVPRSELRLERNSPGAGHARVPNQTVQRQLDAIPVVLVSDIAHEDVELVLIVIGHDRQIGIEQRIAVDLEQGIAFKIAS